MLADLAGQWLQCWHFWLLTLGYHLVITDFKIPADHLKSLISCMVSRCPTSQNEEHTKIEMQDSRTDNQDFQ